MSTETLSEVSQLLSFVSPHRSSQYDSWLYIGTILYRVSNGSNDGLDTWISFSKTSTIYNKDMCSNYWTCMKPSNESIRTLAQYAQEDSFDTYQKYKYSTSHYKISQVLKNKLYRIKPCHFGEVLFVLCKYEFLYDEQNGWYQWKDNTWNSCSKECRVLRNSISMIKDMMLTEYRNMYHNNISPLQNMIRDIEEKEELSTEDKIMIEENYTKVKDMKEKRQYLMTICDKLDELAYKNKIIKECTDLFYDADGIIARDLKSKQVINYQLVLHSPIELFVHYLVIEDKEYSDDIIFLTSDELLRKFNEFTSKKNITINFHPISLIKELKKLKSNNIKYNGITTGVRFCSNNKDIHKTKFNKIEIKNSYGIDF